MMYQNGKYKYVVVGAGLFGCTIAERIANDLGKEVLVVEKKPHIGGLCFSKKDKATGIEYHVYGTHVFHTADKEVRDYLGRFTEFNDYHHQVMTTHKGRAYHMPINLEVINQFFGVNLNPSEAEVFIKKEIKKANIKNPKNLEEKAISLVGEKLYKAFIRGYTIKQWGKDPKELPESIIKRIPFRFNYNENYFKDLWQGIPLNGYGEMFEKMLSNKKITVLLNTEFSDYQINSNATVIYGGTLDELFYYCYGALEWRGLRFDIKTVKKNDYQGVAVMNYADKKIPFVRIVEHKHLQPEKKYVQGKSIITREYPSTTQNLCYPIEDEKNLRRHKQYLKLAKKCNHIIVGGRLGDYKYYDMSDTIKRALQIYYTKIKP